MRIRTLSFVALFLFSPAGALAAEPETDLPSEVAPAAAEGAAAEGAAADAPAEALPPGLADLTPEVREAIQSMDEAAIDALLQKAQQGQPLEAREQAIVDGIMHVGRAAFEAGITYQTGDVVIGDGLATLHLGAGFRYLGPADTERLLVEAWGNPPGMSALGMIVPAEVSPLDQKQGWGVVITYTEEGYVEDDDADDIDYDELLETMQESTEAENEERVRQGYGAVHVVGWAEPPHYDGARNSLYWAKELDFEGQGERSLNYSIRVLGRRGVLELNAVASMSQLAQIKPEMEKIFPLVEYQPGHRYSDFDPDVDEVAAYGIGALIAGKAAVKVGIWAAILKFILAAKKLFIFLGIGLVALVGKLLGRRGKDDQAPPPAQDPDGGQS